MTAEPLKAAAVREGHEAVVAALNTLDVSIRKLMLLTPEGEPAKGQKQAPRMFNPEMVRSAQRISDFIMDINLHSTVIAQNVMGFTEEAREAAIAAQAGKFKVIGQDGDPVVEPVAGKPE